MDEFPSLVRPVAVYDVGDRGGSRAEHILAEGSPNDSILLTFGQLSQPNVIKKVCLLCAL